jgi:hypothetical protein
MFARFAIAVVALLAAGSASAETMTAEAARRFVSGKLFAFNCYDGSRGAGRIYANGSVVGTIQFKGTGPVRSVFLPPGTLHAKGQAVCATLRGMPFDPCFNVERIDDRSFRGSVAGLGFFYCDFSRRMSVARVIPRRHSPPAPETEAAATADATAAAE